MDLYFLKFLVAAKETGKKYPQVVDVPKNYAYENDNSYIKLMTDFFNKKPEITPDLNGLQLQRGARLTDFLSTSLLSHGYLLSQKALNTLKQFKIPDHSLFPVTVQTSKADFVHYTWMHFHYELVSFIDFTQSEYTVYEGLEVIDKVTVNSYEELVRRKSKYSSICTYKASKTCFKNIFFGLYDLFSPGYGNNSYYVTGQLADALISNQISGIELRHFKTESNCIPVA